MKNKMPSEKKKNREPKIINPKTRLYVYITVIVDVLLLAAFITSLVVYVSNNGAETYKQNINNILDITRSNARIADAALNTMGSEVERAYGFCKDKPIGEIMNYLSLANIEGEEYQLLEVDPGRSDGATLAYKGYSTVKNSDDGTYQTVKYSRSVALSMSIGSYTPMDENGEVINGKVAFSQVFTNSLTGFTCFGVFCGIKINDGTIDKQNYLVKLLKDDRLLDFVKSESQYGSFDVAVCYSDGRYLAKGELFRGDNIYDEIGRYNNRMTLDQKNKIKNTVIANKTGEFTYLNFQKEECVFAYSLFGDNNQWLTVTMVPTAEFVSKEMISLLPWLIISFLAALLVFNMFMLVAIVFKLRLSVEREQAANSSKSMFLSRMSHEIRTPLNAIIGYNSIARDASTGAKTEPERIASVMKVMDCLNKSQLASKQLLSVINDVLDMSAIESGRIKLLNEKFDFKGLITTLTMVYYSQAKAKNINFEVRFGNITEEWLIGDQMRVNQVLTNLLSNALKFTPEGGSVTLTITQPDPVENAALIRFEISDTGIGMSEEYLQRIWMPFEQADSSISRRFGGSGLGLSITKSLTDLMKGTIKVKSVLGKGSVFTVDVPFELSDSKEKSAYHSHDFSKINALIVDDDSGTCDYIVSLFNRCGARCAAAHSGEDAINAVKLSCEQNDKYSVCLVDWRMPGMDGVETIRRIREIESTDLPIVVITAYDYAEIAEKAAELGVIKFLAKPLFQSSLFDLLAEICGSKKAETDVVSGKVDFKGARVLLVEDNKMNMEIAKAILQSAGVTVESAWNGKEALDMFTASEEGFYKAVLMDVHMPEMDGLQATRSIRQSAHKQASTIPIIAMTADAFVEDIAETKAAGMNDHISKPIDVPLLFSTLKKYL